MGRSKGLSRDKVILVLPIPWREPLDLARSAVLRRLSGLRARHRRHGVPDPGATTTPALTEAPPADFREKQLQRLHAELQRSVRRLHLWQQTVLHPKGHDTSAARSSPTTGKVATPSTSGTTTAVDNRGLTTTRPQWALPYAKWQDSSPRIRVGVSQGRESRVEVQFEVGLPPEIVFDILTNPNNHRIFKNLLPGARRRVLHEDDDVCHVEVEQEALWRLLLLRGQFTVCNEVWTDKKNHTMRFKLAGHSKFFKVFEGTWTVTGVPWNPDGPFKPVPSRGENVSQPNGSLGIKLPPWVALGPNLLSFGSLRPVDDGTVTVSIATLVQTFVPSVPLPPPVPHFLRRLSTESSKQMIRDVQAEAERLRVGRPIEEPAPAPPLKSPKKSVQQPWRSRRRKSRLFSATEKKQYLGKR